MSGFEAFLEERLSIVVGETNRWIYCGVRGVRIRRDGFIARALGRVGYFRRTRRSVVFRFVSGLVRDYSFDVDYIRRTRKSRE